MCYTFEKHGNYPAFAPEGTNALVGCKKCEDDFDKGKVAYRSAWYITLTEEEIENCKPLYGHRNYSE